MWHFNLWPQKLPLWFEYKVKKIERLIDAKTKNWAMARPDQTLGLICSPVRKKDKSRIGNPNAMVCGLFQGRRPFLSFIITNRYLACYHITKRHFSLPHCYHITKSRIPTQDCHQFPYGLHSHFQIPIFMLSFSTQPWFWTRREPKWLVILGFNVKRVWGVPLGKFLKNVSEI